MKVKRKKREQLTTSDRRRWLMIGLWLAGLVAISALVAYRVHHADTPSSPVSIDSLCRVDIPASMPDTLLRYEGFTVHFNPALHIPNCVTYVLTRDHADAMRDNDNDFAADPAVACCANPADYAKSGYQRGHMAPAADFKWNERALTQTYYMTNIAPQCATLNGGAWRRLEEKVREWAMRDSVLIVHTGPVFTGKPDTIAGAGVAIPDKYFKVVYAPYAHPAQTTVFVLPNSPTDYSLEPYRSTLAEVQRLTHLQFPALNK